MEIDAMLAQELGLLVTGGLPQPKMSSPFYLTTMSHLVLFKSLFFAGNIFLDSLHFSGPPFDENCRFGRRDGAGQTRLEKLVRQEQFSHQGVQKTTPKQ